MNAPVRIGIMSAAHLHADSYINVLRGCQGVEFIGFADEDQERAQQFAQRFNARLYPGYEALLAQKPDGVLVCSETAKHAALVDLAASAGVHVLSEKPIATTLDDGHSMLETCERAGVIFMTAFPMRFSPPAVEVKRMLEHGQLGRIYGCNSTNNGECPKRHRAWFVDKALAGGGAVMDHTVHLADLLRWYLQSEVVEVYAQTNRILYAEDAEVETGGLMILTFENGAFASIDCSWSKPPYYPTWGGLTMDLVGEKGVVSLNAFRQTMTIYGDANRRPVWAYWGSDANQAMIDEFAAAINEGRSPSVTGIDGYKALEIAMAAYRSAETGQPVGLGTP